MRACHFSKRQRVALLSFLIIHVCLVLIIYVDRKSGFRLWEQLNTLYAFSFQRVRRLWNHNHFDRWWLKAGTFQVQLAGYSSYAQPKIHLTCCGLPCCKGESQPSTLSLTESVRSVVLSWVALARSEAGQRCQRLLEKDW